uniref:ClpB_D2-small domain-containing protein n=1 Tax=Heterorhabditis bacteriophora TaxID=37862 RepID=A0A1I7WX45_HETBA
MAHHCRNYPKQEFFIPEEIAYDLQQKFPEYSRKKFKPFVRMVQDGLNRLQIRDRPHKIEELDACKDQGETLCEAKKIMMEEIKNERKRKAKKGLGSVSTMLVQPRMSTVTFENLGGCDRQFLVIDDIDAIAPRRETATREMERRVVSQLSNSLDELFDSKNDQVLGTEITFSNDGELVLKENNFSKEFYPRTCAANVILALIPDSVNNI